MGRAGRGRPGSTIPYRRAAARGRRRGLQVGGRHARRRAGRCTGDIEAVRALIDRGQADVRADPGARPTPPAAAPASGTSPSRPSVPARWPASTCAWSGCWTRSPPPDRRPTGTDGGPRAGRTIPACRSPRPGGDASAVQEGPRRHHATARRRVLEEGPVSGHPREVRPRREEIPQQPIPGVGRGGALAGLEDDGVPDELGQEQVDSLVVEPVTRPDRRPREHRAVLGEQRLRHRERKGRGEHAVEHPSTRAPERPATPRRASTARRPRRSCRRRMRPASRAAPDLLRLPDRVAPPLP